jgi:hypothetical protein
LQRDDNVRILKIHTLESGWCDKDYIMLHAVFQLLVEKPSQPILQAELKERFSQHLKAAESRAFLTPPTQGS